MINSIASAKVKTLQANATVSAATNAAPIAITTSAAHGLETGDIVRISGVTGNLGANGTFVVTKTSSTAFTLNNSNGSGAYVSGGTVQHIGFQATPVLVDNTVYNDTNPDFTVKFRVEKLSSSTTVRAQFIDAADQALTTQEPGPFYSRSGSIHPAGEASFSAKRADWPSARLGNANDYLTVNVILDGAVGASITFSAWIE